MLSTKECIAHILAQLGSEKLTSRAYLHFGSLASSEAAPCKLCVCGFTEVDRTPDRLWKCWVNNERHSRGR